MTNSEKQQKPNAIGADRRIIMGRSPAYPYLPLDKAIERLEQVRAVGAIRQALPPEAFYKFWNLGTQSSVPRQTMAALNHFKLVDYFGRGDDRKVKLSELATRIVLDKRSESVERAAAIREAALSPPIHRELYEKYGAFLPADAAVLTYLTRDRGYNERAAHSLLEEYKRTLVFSGLDQPDNMRGNEEQAGIKALPPIEVGDLVQIEINGALQLEKPTRVRKIQQHEGETWVFVDGSKSGVPRAQVILESKQGSQPHQPVRSDLAVDISQKRDDTPRVGIRREVFDLDEGEVVITFPEILLPASVEDLKGHFELILRKAARRARGQSGRMSRQEMASGTVADVRA